MIQSISSTLYWIGLYVGISALPGEKSRRLRWTVGSAAVLVVWLVSVMLLAANGIFRSDAPRIPVALVPRGTVCSCVVLYSTAKDAAMSRSRT